MISILLNVLKHAWEYLYRSELLRFREHWCLKIWYDDTIIFHFMQLANYILLFYAFISSMSLRLFCSCIFFEIIQFSPDEYMFQSNSTAFPLNGIEAKSRKIKSRKKPKAKAIIVTKLCYGNALICYLNVRWFWIHVMSNTKYVEHSSVS